MRLPSDRVALVVAGDTAACGLALAALGFRRTRQGHVVHPEPTLKFADVRRHFPGAVVRDLPRERIVRIVPSQPPSVAPDAPATPARAIDPLVHGATPVSYTHLAVYKRQASESVRRFGPSV